MTARSSSAASVAMRDRPGVDTSMTLRRSRLSSEGPFTTSFVRLYDMTDSRIRLPRSDVLAGMDLVPESVSLPDPSALAGERLAEPHHRPRRSRPVRVLARGASSGTHARTGQQGGRGLPTKPEGPLGAPVSRLLPTIPAGRRRQRSSSILRRSTGIFPPARRPVRSGCRRSYWGVVPAFPLAPKSITAAGASTSLMPGAGPRRRGAGHRRQSGQDPWRRQGPGHP